MRHWLLILLIALLPLRAWAGSAMVVAMPTAPGTAAHCADHPGATDLSELTDAATPSDDSQQVHDLCDVCNGPAMTLALHSASASPPRHTHIAPACERFASAEPQRGSKPPIA